jgi:hypothetical protein
MSSITPARKLHRAVRGLRLIGLSAIVLAGATLPLHAQNADTAAPSPRANGGWGDHAGRPRHRMAGMEAVAGPASPAILRDTVGLSGPKLQQYSKQYDTYIASTKVARDSLRSNLQAIRSAYESGDRSATRDRRDTVMRQSQDLSRRDQAFEKSLKALLSSDQQKRYDQWKADRQKNERAKWRSEHQDHGREGASSERSNQ